MKYTFLNLAPDEFEDLSRDLLQCHLSMHFESFAPGKDGGIDFRGYKSEDGKIIIQCKRYTKLSDLIFVLKNEVAKVKKLKPDKYILTTSVDLTPENKTQISKLFHGLLSEENIFCASDLNNLVSKFNAVERRHYKLWLASTNVLQSLINNKVLLQSQFEQENLLRISKIYVMNESFEEAFKILKERKFVILSGNPGVGKTTLARVLSYDFVKNGYQLIVASNSIKEAYDAYADGLDQVILFDDFLGRNILEGRYPLNEEQQLVRFIDKIATSKNKLLILTTREYILNQAKIKYETIKSSEIDIAKCIVDVSKYTKFIKAKILFNHLYFADIPLKYIDAILGSRIYLDVVEHENYNPRIIEGIIKKADWEKVLPEQFSSVLLQYFDKPYSIWETAYTSEVSNLSKILLLVMVTTGTPILKDDLRLVLENFFKHYPGKYDVSLNDFNFNASIRELHDTFITTEIDAYDNVAVEFQNPSIQDFLVDYLENNEGLQADIITSAVFYNQLFEIFTSPQKAENDKSGYFSVVRIGLKPKLVRILQQKILSEFQTLGSSKISRHTHKNDSKLHWYRESYGTYKKLDLIISNNYDEKLFFDFVLLTFQENVLPVDFRGWEHNNYLALLKLFQNRITRDASEIMRAFLKHVSYSVQLGYFENFSQIFPEQYKKFISQENLFKTTLDNVVKNEYRSADKDNFTEVISSIEGIINDYGYNAATELNDLQKQQLEYEDYVESSIIDHMGYDAPKGNAPTSENENDRIYELFSFLK